MKILIDCRFWGAKDTGLGRYSQNLVENIVKIDNKNQFVLLVNKYEYGNLTMKQFNNLTVVPVSIPHYSLKEQIIIPRILNKIKPDLIHFPHFNVPILCPHTFIVTIHDLIKHHFKGVETTTRSSLIYWLKHWGYRQVFKNAIEKASKIIVPSNFVKKELLKYYQLNPQKIAVIYEGVDDKLKAQNLNLKTATKNSKLLDKYNIKKPYLLYVGNAYPHKNLRRLILAIKKINSSLLITHHSSLRLVIVCGRDVFAQRLIKVIHQFKAEKFVNLTGPVSDQDLKYLYRKAEAFVSPSLMEGFGLPGLEAMALNCPVLCSNIPTFKEIYGLAVCYFDPKNIDDIVLKIKKIINLPFKEKQILVKKGQEQVKKYSWRKCAGETLKIYESCFSL